MNKQTISRALALVGIAASAVAAYGQGVNVEVNGERVYFPNGRAQMVGGRVLVPLRGVMEQIGAYVNWDPGTRMVTARRGTTDIEMRIGERFARVNGSTVNLDVPAMIIQGSTMVPLRFMSEALGADVNWQAHTNTVRINTQIVEPLPPINPPPTTGGGYISSFRMNVPGGYLRTGDMVHMELFGTPGADVSFSIPGVIGTKRMREERPGFYVMDWTIPSEANGSPMSSIVGKLIYNGIERTIRPTDGPGDFPPSTDITAPRILSMDPESGARVSTARPIIRARIDDGTGSGIATWRMYVDGRDVSDEATFVNGIVRYEPLNRLSTGSHDVRLEVEDRAGNRANSTWNFTVLRAGTGDPGDSSFTFDAPSVLSAGDVIRFTLRAEPNSTVTYSIGNTVLNRSMIETSRGVYTASYTVRRGDDFRNQPGTARVRLDDGQVYTVQSERLLDSRIGGGSGAPDRPVLLSPTSTRVGNTVIVKARSAGADRFHVKIDYASTVLGGLRITGNVHDRTYDATFRGELETESIDLGTPVGGTNTEYTITVTAISPDGTRSEPATMTVRR